MRQDKKLAWIRSDDGKRALLAIINDLSDRSCETTETDIIIEFNTVYRFPGADMRHIMSDISDAIKILESERCIESTPVQYAPKRKEY